MVSQAQRGGCRLRIQYGWVLSCYFESGTALISFCGGDKSHSQDLIEALLLEQLAGDLMKNYDSL